MSVMYHQRKRAVGCGIYEKCSIRDVAMYVSIYLSEFISINIYREQYNQQKDAMISENQHKCHVSVKAGGADMASMRDVAQVMRLYMYIS